MSRGRQGMAIWLLAAGLAAASAPAFAEQWGPIKIAGREVWPGDTQRVPYGGETSFESAFLDAPVFVARGRKRGPTLCFTAGIHGDEINGTEIARRAFSWIDPESLSGTVVAFPMVNAAGVRTQNRYMPDRRDTFVGFRTCEGG